eukprot:11173220-Lingulodinium_polyedra.AAC.1
MVEESYPKKNQQRGASCNTAKAATRQTVGRHESLRRRGGHRNHAPGTGRHVPRGQAQVGVGSHSDRRRELFWTQGVGQHQTGHL